MFFNSVFEGAAKGPTKYDGNCVIKFYQNHRTLQVHIYRQELPAYTPVQ